MSGRAILSDVDLDLWKRSWLWGLMGSLRDILRMHACCCNHVNRLGFSSVAWRGLRIGWRMLSVSDRDAVDGSIVGVRWSVWEDGRGLRVCILEMGRCALRISSRLFLVSDSAEMRLRLIGLEAHLLLTISIGIKDTRAL